MRPATSSPVSPSAGTSATTASATSSGSRRPNGPTAARSPRSRSPGCSSGRSPARSKNPLKDTLGAVEDVVAMTDRVIEIRLIAPRPNLLPLLAQPEFAVVRDGAGHRAVQPIAGRGRHGAAADPRRSRPATRKPRPREEVAARAAKRPRRRSRAFAAGKSDLVLGGSFTDLPFAQRVKVPRGSLRFDPASGLFGLVPVRSGGRLDEPEIRQLLSQAIDRDGFDRRVGRSRSGGPRDPARARARRRSRAGHAGVGRDRARRPPAGARSAQANRLLGDATSRRSGSPCPMARAPTCCLRELALRLGRARVQGRARANCGRRRLRADRRGRAVDLAGVVRAPLPLRGGAGVRRGHRRIARCARGPR